MHLDSSRPNPSDVELRRVVIAPKLAQLRTFDASPLSSPVVTLGDLRGALFARRRAGFPASGPAPDPAGYAVVAACVRPNRLSHRASTTGAQIRDQ